MVEDGIALRPIDVDAVFLFGYGFPRFRGGPMHYADTIGAAELVEPDRGLRRRGSASIGRCRRCCARMAATGRPSPI